MPAADALENLTPEGRAHVRACLPTGKECMVSWATPVLARSGVERRVLVAAQMLVLDGLYEDPAGWCARSLELAAEERGRHG